MSQTDQTITLHGREYRVRSPFEPEYTKKLAEYCDALMKSIGTSTGSTDYLGLSALTLLQLAHNYFQQVEIARAANPEIEEKISRLIASLERTEKEMLSASDGNDRSEGANAPLGAS